MAILQEKQELKTLSIEELKQCKGLGHLSKKQATQIIENLKNLAIITYQIIRTKNEPITSISKVRQENQRKENS